MNSLQSGKLKKVVCCLLMCELFNAHLNQWDIKPRESKRKSISLLGIRKIALHLQGNGYQKITTGITRSSQTKNDSSLMALTVSGLTWKYYPVEEYASLKELKDSAVEVA
jgi:hypothetical protein